MVGITRIATYFPRRRLDRALLAKAWGTRVAPGARTVAGIDEDALTMAVDAVLECTRDADAADFDALYFASTSSPTAKRGCTSPSSKSTLTPRFARMAAMIEPDMPLPRMATSKVWSIMPS